ncbi:LysR family transcriptional regulator [Parvibaculum sedimenti]|uniref:LysR family transcriptional regulator n=1 Tax=Parvibaculum sedimenti TaxID=2608632 RepID=A0A6N6VER9_9HYPH|nr:LysR family transcriptional regulator [Parvibaculum sedimenti]KAB7739065.1 LysR family transcriptional regulator [Parvibaculum sedimenti]
MHPNLLDQLEVFLAVAETGSFSGAAKRLGRAVSAVSYAITNLESELRVEVFDRSGYKPELTGAGRAVLSDAEIIFRRVDRLKARTAALRERAEVELSIVADAEFDVSTLARAAGLFHQEMPHVGLRFSTDHAENILARIGEGQAQIGILGLFSGFKGKKLDGREIAAWPKRIVAAPFHPLAKLNAPFPLIALDDHRQIVLAAHEKEASSLDYKVHTTDFWIADGQGMMLALLREGLGWAFAIEHMVADDIARGQLVALRCSGVNNPPLQRFAAVWAVKTPPGPAAQHFVDCLAGTGHRIGELQPRY